MASAADALWCQLLENVAVTRAKVHQSDYSVRSSVVSSENSDLAIDMVTMAAGFEKKKSLVF